MKLIKISTDMELTVHNFPFGNFSEENKELRKLIGNGCSIYDHVLPRRLYTEMGMKNCPTKVPGECVSMLVDEEGYYKDLEVNVIGSYLYETDKHGNPILGNILFVGEMETGSGIDFCGIADSMFDKICEGLKVLIEKARKSNEH